MGTPAHSRRSQRTYLSSSSITSIMADIDLNNRDPNNINDHLRVTFEDVLAEPEGIHSMNCEWGNEVAEIAFCHIWYVTPCFKVCELNCGCLQKLYGMLVHCCLDPWCEAVSLCFQAFKK